jgi:hypothetical protein
MTNSGNSSSIGLPYFSSSLFFSPHSLSFYSHSQTKWKHGNQAILYTSVQNETKTEESKAEMENLGLFFPWKLSIINFYQTPKKDAGH